MKRCLLIICAVLALIFVAGCGDKLPQPPVTDNPSERQELVLYTNGVQPQDLDTVLAKANEYLLKKLNCTLKVRFVENMNYATRLTTIISTGEPCDIAASFGNDPAGGFNYRVQARVGYLLMLDDYLAKNAPELLNNIPALMRNAAYIDGKVAAVPVPDAMAAQRYLSANTALFPAKGGNDALDGAAMLKMFGAVHNRHPGIVCLGNPAQLAEPGFDFICGSFVPGAVRLADGNARVFNQFEDPEYIGHLKLIRDCFAAGYSVREIEWSAAAAGWKVGDIFAVIDRGGWNSGAANGTGYARWPLAAPVIRMQDVVNRSFVIPVTAKYPARAVKLLNLLYTDSYLKNLLTFGIEGRHYEKLANGQIKFLAAHQGYLVDERTFGNPFPDYVPEGQPSDKWQQVARYDKAAQISPLAGFSPDYDRLKMYLPAITAICEQYAQPLKDGSGETGDTLKQLNGALQNAGLRDYLQELQRQVDEWRKTKI